MEFIAFVKKENVMKAENKLKEDFDVAARQSIKIRDAKSLELEGEGSFFYITGSDEGVAKCKELLEEFIAQPFIEEKVGNVEVDKRFVYYLLAAQGICVVPLTGFCCRKKGFRITLLESDDAKRKWTWNTIAQSIKHYLTSA